MRHEEKARPHAYLLLLKSIPLSFTKQNKTKHPVETPLNSVNLYFSAKMYISCLQFFSPLISSNDQNESLRIL